MSEEKKQGITFEEAHAALPVGRMFNANTLTNNLIPRFQAHIELGRPYREIDEPVYHGEVVDALKAQIEELQMQIEGYKALAERLKQEDAAKYPQDGWFLPAEMLNQYTAKSLDQVIQIAKGCSITDVIVRPNGEDVRYEADWVKYMKRVGPSQVNQVAVTLNNSVVSQAWVVKLGAAVASLHEPILINRLTTTALDEKYQRLMQRCGLPESHSVLESMKQLVNEITYGSIPLVDVVQKATEFGYDTLNKTIKTVYLNPRNQVEVRKDPVCKHGWRPEKCCLRNRPIDIKNECIVFATPSELRAAIQDTSKLIAVNHDPVSGESQAVYAVETEVDCARCPQAAVTPGCCGGWPKESKPVYSEAALRDQTNIQKALVMGLAGTDAQKEEARIFLKQAMSVEINDVLLFK